MDSIVEQAKLHLKAALADPSDHLPDPGPRWATFAAWTRESIASLTTATEAVRFAQSAFGHGGFESRHRGASLRELAEPQELFIEGTFFPDFAPHRLSFDEPDFADPETTMQHRGRRVSGPLYTHTTFLYTVARYVPTTDTVCEIGGGYGAPARLWLNNTYRPAKTYVVIDLPESLFFAECYLRATLGDAAVHYIGSEPPTDNPRVILCPVSRLAALPPMHFDVVINTLSMQEMSDGYVDFYRDWIGAQSVDYFYSFNYWLQSIDQLSESANLCAPRLPPGWTLEWSSAATEETPDVDQFANILVRKTGRNEPATFASPLSPESLIPAFIAAEQSSDARFTFALLKAMLADLSYMPKEVGHLCRLTYTFDAAQPCLNWLQRIQLWRIARQVNGRLSRASTNRVPPHLETLKGSLAVGHSGSTKYIGRSAHDAFGVSSAAALMALINRPRRIS